jgi:hypothetical protein
MSKNRKINVDGREITVVANNEQDYISLTDMVRNIENGLALIEKWLRNKNTIEFLGIWEQMYNPDFNSPEFEGIKNEAGLNRFVLSVKQWTEKTGSVGVIAKAGRYGGTYAHKDIAFEFANSSIGTHLSACGHAQADQSSFACLPTRQAAGVGRRQKETPRTGTASKGGRRDIGVYGLEAMQKGCGGQA